MKRGAVTLAGAAAFSALTAQVFFAGATVTVQPESRQVNAGVEMRIEAVPESEDALTGRALSYAASDTRKFPATGTGEEKSRAKGVIRVFNAATTSPYTLIPQTRFMSEEGRLFRTPERIVIPGATWSGGRLEPGSVDATVVAAEAGSEYNIPSSSFSLPGLAGTASYTSVYAKSFSPMEGGGRSSVPVVTREDVASAERQLSGALQEEAQAEIRSLLGEGEVLLRDAVSAVPAGLTILAKEGARLESFEASARVEAAGMAFQSADVLARVKEVLEQMLGEDELLRDGSLRISYEVVRWDRERGVLRIRAEGTAEAVQKLDGTALKMKIRGRSAKEADRILEEVRGVADHALELAPFWITSIPEDITKIQVVYSLDE